jgi:hypothetical protein
VELFGSLAEIQIFRDGDEITDVTQFHGGILHRKISGIGVSSEPQSGATRDAMRTKILEARVNHPLPVFANRYQSKGDEVLCFDNDLNRCHS